ncbi:MAG: hypothetical protein WKF93_07745 [Acidimicrobiales bacterium]
MAPWGSQTRFSTIGDGRFHCPRCALDRPYELRCARRWLAIGPVPLLPRRRLATVVECGVCAGRYDERVRTGLTDADFAERLSVALRALAVAVATADGPPGPATRRTVLRTVGRSVVHAYGMAELDADLAALADRRPEEFLDALQGMLNEAGRERLVRAAVEIAHAEGHPAAASLVITRAAGAALGMTATRIDHVVRTAGHCPS